LGERKRIFYIGELFPEAVEFHNASTPPTASVIRLFHPQGAHAPMQPELNAALHLGPMAADESAQPNPAN
jgi:hypothetical protein